MFQDLAVGDMKNNPWASVVEWPMTIHSIDPCGNDEMEAHLTIDEGIRDGSS